MWCVCVHVEEGGCPENDLRPVSPKSLKTYPRKIHGLVRKSELYLLRVELKEDT